MTAWQYTKVSMFHQDVYRVYEAVYDLATTDSRLELAVHTSRIMPVYLIGHFVISFAIFFICLASVARMGNRGSYRAPCRHAAGMRNLKTGKRPAVPGELPVEH
jgi:hypothetical protein